MGARRIPKALVHADGALFCNWHDTKPVYAIYVSDADVPPLPEDLDLNTDINTYGLRWVPIIAGGYEMMLHPYDDETGEELT